MPIKRRTTSENKSTMHKTTTEKTAVENKTRVIKTTMEKEAVKKKVTGNTASEEVLKQSNIKKEKTVPKKTAVKKSSVTKKEQPKKKATKKKIATLKIKNPAPSVNSRLATKKIENKKPALVVMENEHIYHGVTGPVSSIPRYEIKPDEVYMSDTQLQHFMRVLIAWRGDLLEGVDKTVGHLKEEARNYADFSDRATQEEEFSLELRTRDRERKLLKKIESAIQRISDNSFGYCEVCGVEIGLPRLEVRPTATLCIDCKTVAEIREKQTAL